MAKGTLNPNSVNNYMANYEWDEDVDDLMAEDERKADRAWLESAGYTVDEDGKIVFDDKKG